MSKRYFLIQLFADLRDCIKEKHLTEELWIENPFLSGNITYTRIAECHCHILLLPLVCWTTDPIKYIVCLKYNIFPTDCFSVKIIVFLILALNKFSFCFTYIICNSIIYQSFNTPTILKRTRKYTTTWAVRLKFLFIKTHRPHGRDAAS